MKLIMEQIAFSSSSSRAACTCVSNAPCSFTLDFCPNTTAGIFVHISRGSTPGPCLQGKQCLGEQCCRRAVLGARGTAWLPSSPARACLCTQSNGSSKSHTRDVTKGYCAPAVHATRSTSKHNSSRTTVYKCLIIQLFLQVVHRAAPPKHNSSSTSV